MSIWQKLHNIDRRWIYLVLGIMVIIPLFAPFRLATQPTAPVERLFRYIDTMPQDKALVISVDFTPDTQAELLPMVIALLRHAFATKHKVGVLTLEVYGLGLARDALAQVANEFNACAATRCDSIIDGEDYVFWGWTTPPVTVMLGMGKRISDVFPIDYSKRQTDSLPIMRNLRNYEDVGILVCCAASAMPRSWINYAQVEFGVKLGCGITAVSAADFYPYLNSGQLTGMLAGMKGAAEYEELVAARMSGLGFNMKLRRRGLEAMSSQTSAHLTIILLIVVGNIAFAMTRRKGRP